MYLEEMAKKRMICFEAIFIGNLMISRREIKVQNIQLLKSKFYEKTGMSASGY